MGNGKYHIVSQRNASRNADDRSGKSCQTTENAAYFRTDSKLFTELGVRAVEAANQQISCKKGCAACCRQPVPLAEIEAYRIAEIVENLPEPSRTKVKDKFDKAAKHFHETGWFEKLENCREKEEIEKNSIGIFFRGRGLSVFGRRILFDSSRPSGCVP